MSSEVKTAPALRTFLYGLETLMEPPPGPTLKLEGVMGSSLLQAALPCSVRETVVLPAVTEVLLSSERAMVSSAETALFALVTGPPAEGVLWLFAVATASPVDR